MEGAVHSRVRLAELVASLSLGVDLGFGQPMEHVLRQCLLARGASNKEIAVRLVITPKTARNHVEHIYAKIGASSRASAALFAVQHGLLPEDEIAAAPAEPYRYSS
jgi:hypothetical protein